MSPTGVGLRSFARRHAARLTEGEREVWGPSSGGGGWAPWALFSYICLLTWQVGQQRIKPALT